MLLIRIGSRQVRSGGAPHDLSFVSPGDYSFLLQDIENLCDTADIFSVILGVCALSQEVAEGTALAIDIQNVPHATVASADDNGRAGVGKGT